MGGRSDRLSWSVWNNHMERGVADAFINLSSDIVMGDMGDNEDSCVVFRRNNIWRRMQYSTNTDGSGDIVVDK